MINWPPDHESAEARIAGLMHELTEAYERLEIYRQETRELELCRVEKMLLVRERNKLRAALEPFATRVEWLPEIHDDEYVFVALEGCGPDDVPEFQVRDFRRARAVFMAEGTEP